MLSVIIGNAEIALNRIKETDPVYKQLQQIMSAGLRSADLTRQLLAFARKQTVTPKILNLNDTVESMLKMLRRLIGEDINLVWLPGKMIWPVKMDPTQIDQIMANLCVNARDAIKGVGKVTIETGTCSFDEAYCAYNAGFIPGDYVILTVSDTGSGMDKKTIDSIFEPFFTTKEVGQGTGLGLATVYGIVKQNNGFINVYSEPGLGATFKIFLPRYAGEVTLVQKEDNVEPLLRGNEVILLVEDEPTILEMTSIMLENLGYTVLTAVTPGEAIRLAGERSSPIDLLLTDVVMPGMNGRDLAQNMTHFHPGIKHLFMSGYTADVIAHQDVLDEGVNFIQKPFSEKGLAEKVREVLSISN
jgi:nitrogen-specific signal transduction histidine kinase